MFKTRHCYIIMGNKVPLRQIKNIHSCENKKTSMHTLKLSDKKNEFFWIPKLANQVVHEIPVILKKVLHQITCILRPLLHLYVRSICSKRNDTLRFADKKPSDAREWRERVRERDLRGLRKTVRQSKLRDSAQVERFVFRVRKL